MGRLPRGQHSISFYALFDVQYFAGEVVVLWESHCFAGRSPEHEHCSWTKTAVNVLLRQGFDGP